MHTSTKHLFLFHTVGPQWFSSSSDYGVLLTLKQGYVVQGNHSLKSMEENQVTAREGPKRADKRICKWVSYCRHRTITGLEVNSSSGLLLFIKGTEYGC